MQLPENIRRLTAGRAYTADTLGMSGAQIFCFEDRVLKIEKQGAESEHEREMLLWLEGRLPAPRVLAAESENGINYLLMSRMRGELACSPALLAQPELLSRRLAGALQQLWQVNTDGMPAAAQSCLEGKLRFAEERVSKGLCSMEDMEPGTYGRGGFTSPEQLLQWLQANRPPEEPVFSHGDFCLPNIFLPAQGGAGLIDWGRSGILDRYQDIALGYRSLKENFAGDYGGKAFPGFYPELLFDALDIRPDWERVRYYILLDELF